MSIDTVKKIFKGQQITLDLENKRCKRITDDKWIPFNNARFVALTQVRMKQDVHNGVYLSVRTKYNAFCVYIKTEKLNIQAFRGSRDKVIEEAERIGNFLNVPVKDLIPRDKDGNVADDDYGDVISSGQLSNIMLIFFLIVIFGIILSMFFA